MCIVFLIYYKILLEVIKILLGLYEGYMYSDRFYLAYRNENLKQIFNIIIGHY